MVAAARNSITWYGQEVVDVTFCSLVAPVVKGEVGHGRWKPFNIGGTDILCFITYAPIGYARDM